MATSKLQFTNTAPGPRGVHGVDGLVLIEAGQSATIEVTDAEAKSAKSTGYFEIGAAKAVKEKAPETGSKGAKEKAPEDGLEKLSLEDLQAVAGNEGVKIEGLSKPEEIVAAIRKQRAAS